MDSNHCPLEEQLLACLAGDGAEATKHHVSNCPRCKKSLEILQAESTILQQIHRSESATIASDQISMPAMVGKYIVVGLWDDGESFTTFRGLHAIVHQEVLIQWSKAPLRDDRSTKEMFTASLTHWMHPRPHVAPLLDSGIFQSRPYVVVKYDGQTRLDRLHDDEQQDTDALLRIFGSVASALCTSIDTPHPLLRRSSIVIDDAEEATLVDWSAATLFGTQADATSIPTVRLLAEAFRESLFREPDIPPALSPDDLARQMIDRKIPPRAAKILAQALAEPLDQIPSLIDIATRLMPTASSKWWKRLLGR